MTGTAAFLILTLSPIIYLMLFLNVRYTIVYTVLRKKRSRTFLKKHSGNFKDRVFLKRFKSEIDLLYYINGFLVIWVASSVIISFFCIIILMIEDGFCVDLFAQVYLKLDIVTIVVLTIKQIYDKILKRE